MSDLIDTWYLAVFGILDYSKIQYGQLNILFNHVSLKLAISIQINPKSRNYNNIQISVQQCVKKEHMKYKPNFIYKK